MEQFFCHDHLSKNYRLTEVTSLCTFQERNPARQNESPSRQLPVPVHTVPQARDAGWTKRMAPPAAAMRGARVSLPGLALGVCVCVAVAGGFKKAGPEPSRWGLFPGALGACCLLVSRPYRRVRVRATGVLDRRLAGGAVRCACVRACARVCHACPPRNGSLRVVRHARRPAPRRVRPPRRRGVLRGGRGCGCVGVGVGVGQGDVAHAWPCTVYRPPPPPCACKPPPRQPVETETKTAHALRHY